MPRHRRGFDLEAAHAHLVRADPALAPWLRRHGPLPAPAGWRRRLQPVDALARAILYQQLSGKAAATIVARVEAAAGSRRLDAAALMRVDDARLRACGVSANKLRALRDLAARAEAGQVPDARRLAYMDAEAIVQALLPVRGIGRWTVEMLLMFQLGRPDVLPLDDLGIRKGAQLLDGLPQPPDAAGLRARGAAWAPYRTYAALWLWRIVALVRDEAQA
ncbi:DNA-3-methyladenine glycosylase family protein [Thermomonas flagellata]|uniref:DNA-3-methyladenine glycosylase family protein n=1 Tax=Thermomonas flagellata TaxID=2888524 RepID=UPI001F044D57|nr:DNA-3-methyladenine glycosylase 2 family protein [Thermomonas flagellata]